MAVPTPAQALLDRGFYCNDNRTVGGLAMCNFGVQSTAASTTVALIGDSHAASWGPALAYTANRNDWAGVGLIHNGCAFSDATMRSVSSSYAAGCAQWRDLVIAWLQQNPQVSTLVIVGYDIWSFVGDAQQGYDQLWNSIPATVKRIFIIRDVPDGLSWQADCITYALSHHQRPFKRCAAPRKRTLAYDRQAAAAANSPPPRVHLLDFTPFFCDTKLCYPVVGGVLVLKDLDHLTQAFGVTLGPYLRRAINAIIY